MVFNRFNGTGEMEVLAKFRSNLVLLSDFQNKVKVTLRAAFQENKQTKKAKQN